MTFDISDRVVVITGASRGLGSAFAEHFANSGASLGLLARNEDALIDLASKVPTDAVPIACDVTRTNDVRAAYSKIVARFGRIDSVVVNAGALLHAKRAEWLSASNWRDVIDLNLNGAFITANEAYNYLRDSRSGRLLFVSSRGSRFPVHGTSAYSAAKAGIEGLVRALALEWASSGVCVNALSPGFIDYGGTRSVDGKYRQRILNRTVLRQPGKMSDLLGPALLFVSDASAYITGQTLAVDGGFGLR